MSKSKPSKKDEYYTGIYWKDYEKGAEILAEGLAEAFRINEERKK